MTMAQRKNNTRSKAELVREYLNDNVPNWVIDGNIEGMSKVELMAAIRKEYGRNDISYADVTNVFHMAKRALAKANVSFSGKAKSAMTKQSTTISRIGLAKNKPSEDDGCFVVNVDIYEQALGYSTDKLYGLIERLFGLLRAKSQKAA